MRLSITRRTAIRQAAGSFLTLFTPAVTLGICVPTPARADAATVAAAITFASTIAKFMQPAGGGGLRDRAVDNALGTILDLHKFTIGILNEMNQNIVNLITVNEQQILANAIREIQVKTQTAIDEASKLGRYNRVPSARMKSVDFDEMNTVIKLAQSAVSAIQVNIDDRTTLKGTYGIASMGRLAWCIVGLFDTFHALIALDSKMPDTIKAAGWRPPGNQFGSSITAMIMQLERLVGNFVQSRLADLEAEYKDVLAGAIKQIGLNQWGASLALNGYLNNKQEGEYDNQEGCLRSAYNKANTVLSERIPSGKFKKPDSVPNDDIVRNVKDVTYFQSNFFRGYFRIELAKTPWQGVNYIKSFRVTDSKASNIQEWKNFFTQYTGSHVTSDARGDKRFEDWLRVTKNEYGLPNKGMGICRDLGAYSIDTAIQYYANLVNQVNTQARAQLFLDAVGCTRASMEGLQTKLRNLVAEGRVRRFHKPRVSPPFSR